MRIDQYKFGEIVIDGQPYSRDLLILADRVAAGWWRDEGHKLSVTDLEDILADPPQVLVVGTGRYGRMSVLSETQQALAAEGVELVACPTKAACQTYNEMASAGKRVMAALHLTC
jgi:hypothetical protein